MKPTPETDALDRELHNPRVLADRYSEMMEHAQNMERERDEARDRERVAILSFDEERQRALREGERVLEARRERDEARADLEFRRELYKVQEEYLEAARKELDEAMDEINIIRNTLSQNGEAVGNGEHNFSIIEMVENLMQSKDYFVRKSDSLERERDEARKIASELAIQAK
jgi:hypothetical protein